MGLNYGDAEGERPGGKGKGVGFGRGKGRRGAVLGGRVSVDSMKLKYEEGWDAEAVSASRRPIARCRHSLTPDSSGDLKLAPCGRKSLAAGFGCTLRTAAKDGASVGCLTIWFVSHRCSTRGPVDVCT